MSAPNLKLLRSYMTAIGAALPALNPLKHGQFTIKQAAATEDELYSVLRDSAGALQHRRILTKTYADTLYGVPLTVQEGGVTTDATVGTLNFDASDFTLTESPEDTVSVALAYGTSAGTPAEGNHTHAQLHDAVTVLDGTGIDFTLSGQQITAEPKFAGTGAAGTVSRSDHTHSSLLNEFPNYTLLNKSQAVGTEADITTNATLAQYIGRADAAYTNITVRVEVTTNASSITWAEIGIGTAPQIVMNGAATITTRGYTDVSGVVNTTGVKEVSITVSGIAAGDHLWALTGAQATTTAGYRPTISDTFQTGAIQGKSTTRPSTMAADSVFAVQAGSIESLQLYWIGT